MKNVELPFSNEAFARWLEAHRATVTFSCVAGQYHVVLTLELGPDYSDAEVGSKLTTERAIRRLEINAWASELSVAIRAAVTKAEARAMKMMVLCDLIVRARKIAEAVRGAVAVGRLPELEERLAKLIDEACSIEAELGLDKLGCVADAFDVPLGGDVPIRGSFGCDVLAEGVVPRRRWR